MRVPSGPLPHGSGQPQSTNLIDPEPPRRSRPRTGRDSARRNSARRNSARRDKTGLQSTPNSARGTCSLVCNLLHSIADADTDKCCERLGSNTMELLTKVCVHAIVFGIQCCLRLHALRQGQHAADRAEACQLTTVAQNITQWVVCRHRDCLRRDRVPPIG
eukprot:2636502-Prymnesium_polylepis.1